MSSVDSLNSNARSASNAATAANNAANPASTASKKKGADADYQTFITLLVAQMKNQDPTKPMDSTEFVSQLASFSAVEQQTQSNKKLDSLLGFMTVNGPINQAADYVGKYLVDEDNKLEGKVESIKIYTNGITATLDNGKEVVIGAGVSIYNQKPDSAGNKDKA